MSEQYDDICEVFTDKLVAKIPSTHDGVIKSIKYKNDEICPVGQALIEIEVNETGAGVSPELPKETKKLTAAESSSSSEETGTVGRTKLSAAINSSNEKVLATPAVRSIAKRNSIDLKQVPATGKDGRVMKEDILAFIDGGTKPKASPSLTETSQAKSSSSGEIVVKMAPLTGVKPEDEVRKLTGMKKAMTKTMTESRSIPFFMFSDEIEVTQLLILRQALKNQHKNLTLLPFFVKAASIAMTEYPIMNSNFNPETDEDGYIKEYVIKKDQNFSIAIDSKDGLTVPNIKRIQDKSILQINQEIIGMRERSDQGKLTAADFEGATFSISSVGNIGGTYFVPTILRPQVAIMAIGKARKIAKYVEDSTKEDGYKFIPADTVSAPELSSTLQINISISADHRILDGATVARFSARMKELIENPNVMLISMS